MDTSARNKLGLLILGAAAALGLLGDAMFRSGAVGVNVPIFLAAFTACGAALYAARVLPIARSTAALGAVLLALGSLFLWHESVELKLLNGLAILTVVGVGLLRSRQGSLSVAGLIDYPFKAAGYLFLPFVDFANLIGWDIQWKTMGGSTRAKKASAVARGVVIAVPLLLIFGALFVSADASFESSVHRLFSFNAEDLPNDLILFGFVAWLVGGVLRRVYLAPDPKPAAPPIHIGPDGLAMVTTPPAAPPSLGITEVAIILGALNLLFAAFVATQFGHFFGTAQWVHDTRGVTFANYARRGFFELVAVAGLALPTLIGLHSLLRREDPKHEVLFRVLAWMLIGLVFVVIDSAADKMRLYVGAYGLTTLRFYVCASLGWVAVLTVWFGLTALRGRTDRFAWGGVVAFLAVVFAANILNPDALIARVNTSRPNGARVDSEYLTLLSDDAVPALASAMDRVPGAQRGRIAIDLKGRLSSKPIRDWRGWTLGRAEAGKILEREETRIRAEAAVAEAAEVHG